MKFDYTIKNFRAFDAKGATFTISPITILTGTNSSGKSSMAKSLRLLDKYLSKVKYAADGNRCRPVVIPLEISDKEGQLGNYQSVLNKKASKNGALTFEYSVYSTLLQENCRIKYVFGAKQNDINGTLRAIDIVSERGDFNCSFQTDWKEDKKDGKDIEKALSCTRLNREGMIKAFLDFVALFYPNCLTEQDSVEFNEKRDRYLTSVSAFQKMNGFLFRLEDIPQDMAFFMLRNRTLVYLPILEVLGKEEKSEDNPVIPFMDEKDQLYPAYLSVKGDFLGSEHKTLLDYVKSKEQEYIHSIPYELSNEIALAQDFFSHIGENADLYLTEHDTDTTKVPFMRIVNVLSRLSELHFAPEANNIAFFEQVRRNNRLPSTYYGPANRVRSINLFDRFNEAVFRELLIPFFVGNITYVSSSRAIVRRIYSLNDASNPLEEQLARFISLEKGETNSDAMSFINSWIKKFGIGEELILKQAEDGAGIIPMLRKNVGDEPTSLADEGYGITQLLSVLLNIGISIHEYGVVNEKFNYGGTYYPTIIIIEEPEIHLHPRMQSLLADMFIEAARDFNICFIIETHSEYIVRSIQYHIAIHRNPAKGIPADDAAIYYISSDSGEDDRVKRIEVQPDGSLGNSFGPGFFDESKRQLLERLKIRAQNG